MELPNLLVSIPANISAFAEAKGEEFSKIFFHCLTRIQADEVRELRANGAYICAALIKKRKPLATKIATNPKNCSGYILEEVKTLNDQEIQDLLTNVEDEYPLWRKRLHPLLRWIANSIVFASMDDMFELDSEALYTADKKQLKEVLQLVYLVGLTIPEGLELGNRVQTFLSDLSEK
jgi:hypothetical protein